jgi:hypothetical protein
VFLGNDERCFLITIGGSSTALSGSCDRCDALVKRGGLPGRDERLGPGPVGGAVLPDGSFVRNSDMHFDVPLFRQCWKLESPKRELAACSLRRIDSAVNPYVRKHYS